MSSGLFSVIMRDMSNLTNTECPKWIVLDGDIDTMWIESLNTVMDDNKVCNTNAHAYTCKKHTYAKTNIKLLYYLVPGTNFS